MQPVRSILYMHVTHLLRGELRDLGLREPRLSFSARHLHPKRSGGFPFVQNVPSQTKSPVAVKWDMSSKADFGSNKHQSILLHVKRNCQSRLPLFALFKRGSQQETTHSLNCLVYNLLARKRLMCLGIDKANKPIKLATNRLKFGRCWFAFPCWFWAIG